MSNLRLVRAYETVSLVLSEGIISPDGNGIRDVVLLRPRYSSKEDLRRAFINVSDSKGTVVRTLEIDLTEEKILRPIVFDGTTATKERLADGRYKLQLLAEYDSGNAPSFGEGIVGGGFGSLRG